MYCLALHQRLSLCASGLYNFIKTKFLYKILCNRLQINNDLSYIYGTLITLTFLLISASYFFNWVPVNQVLVDTDCIAFYSLQI